MHRAEFVDFRSTLAVPQLLRLLTVIILVVSSQFCDGHDTQQLCAAFTLVGISRQMLSNSVIYVGLDITLFLRRT